jgi:hypothetical protein
MTRKRGRAVPIARGDTKRVSADLDADVYNDLAKFCNELDIEASRIVRIAIKDFILKYDNNLRNDPVQLIFDLSRS